MRGAIFKWIAILILTGVVLISALNFAVWLFLYHPRAYRVGYEQKLGEGVEELRFRTAAGEQRAFYLPANAAMPERIWFVFCGNGSVALDWLPFMRAERAPRDAVLLIDYPGYGKSEGRPTVEGARAAADAALTVIASRLGATTDPLEPRLNVIGHSLGAAVALEFAQEHRQVGRVILLAPFTSLRAEASRFLGSLGRVILFDYDNRAILRALAARQPQPKVFIFHGRLDGMIPSAMSAEMAAEFPTLVTFKILPEATHDTVLRDASDQMRALMQ